MSSGMTKSIHHAPLARGLAAGVGVAYPVTGEDDRAPQLVEDIVREAPRRIREIRRRASDRAAPASSASQG